MPDILVVEDEDSARQLLQMVLGAIPEFTVHTARHGLEAWERLQGGLMPDAMVLDVTMPMMSGYELCQKLRQDDRFHDLPVLMLTARDTPQDRYRGFHHGIDDFVSKPYDPIELQLRVKALLRRRGAMRTDRQLRYGSLVLDLARHEATTPRGTVALTASEEALLAYLMRHPEEVVSVETLLVKALDYPPHAGNPQVIHTHVRRLRQKIEADPSEPVYLTSNRRGYCLLGGP